MRKQNIYIYPLEGKVIFPYHEYRFTISSHSYQRTSLIIQLNYTIISSDFPPSLINSNSTELSSRLRGYRDMGPYLRYKNQTLWPDIRYSRKLRSTT